MLKCTFPSCNARLEPNQAKVPAIEAVRNATGKPVVTVADLAGFALCGRDARLVERESKSSGNEVKMYSYAGTAALIKSREAKQEAARTYSLQLRAKTQMGKAIAKALTQSVGSTGQSGQGVPKPQPR